VLILALVYLQLTTVQGKNTLLRKLSLLVSH